MLRIPIEPQKRLSYLYWTFAFLRITLVFVPQTGYIHPDEFFQTTEVLAARIFDLDGHIPWEFDSAIRGMTLPIHTIGLLMNVIRMLTNPVEFLTPYILLTLPRLLMALLSFIVDYFFYLICRCANEPYNNRMVVLASSYIMYTYGTRTLSNTFEMLCFAMLLFYIAEANMVTHHQACSKWYAKMRATTLGNRSVQQVFKIIAEDIWVDQFRSCWKIATIAVTGFFVRPTFFFFALFPVWLYLTRDITKKYKTGYNTLFLRLLAFAFYCLPVVAINILVDSIFYMKHDGLFTLSDVTVTPWNFIKYNLSYENLSNHGLHPRFLHILINMPLNFGFLGVIALIWITWASYRTFRGLYTELPEVHTIRGVMTLGMIAPLVFLSVFPHQEPRFLIPLIFPLVFLYGKYIYWEPPFLIRSKNRRNLISRRDGTKLILYLWILINIIPGIYYGFLHQRGVYPTVEYLHRSTKNDTPMTEYFIATSYVHTLPQTLALKYSVDAVSGRLNDRLHIHEIGTDVPKYKNKIQQVYYTLLRRHYLFPDLKFKFYFIAPATIIKDYGMPEGAPHWNITTLLQEIPLHVSTEVVAMKFDEYFLRFLQNYRESDGEIYKNESIAKLIVTTLSEMPEVLALQIWKIEFDLI